MITQVGKHRVKCGDLMNGIDDLMQDEMADFIYSDPPWGQGNLGYWQTINKRHTGQEPSRIDYKKFLTTFFDILRRYAKDRVVIEYGIRWREDITRTAKAYGFETSGWATTYYKSGSRKLPCDIHFFHRASPMILSNGLLEYLRDNSGVRVPVRVLAEFAPNGGIALDPMCGMGYTAQAAVKSGMSFRGLELNSKRLAKTIQFLNKSVT